MFNQILCGNHLDILPKYPDNYFDMFLTSPPYDNLRDYEGYNFQFEPLAHELYRTLKPGGVGVWIVNDMTIDGNETLTSFKQALYFKENVGFKLNDTMIYAKNGCRFPVGHNHTKYGNAFEYMFILAKGKPLTFHLIKDRKNTQKGKILTGTERQRDGSLTYMRGKGKQHAEKGARSNVWIYTTGFMLSSTDIESFQHPATFPEKLAEDHILSWSNPGDVVLDPMCGSGTTCKMAIKHGRQYVGIDIAEKYCELARKRIDRFTAQKDIFISY